MNHFSVTHVTPPIPDRRGGYHRFINAATRGVAATVTSRYGAVSYNNIITLAHYPMTCVMYKL